MRYLLILFSVLTLQNAWADVTLKILDQNGLPVSDTIITLPNLHANTPNTISIMDQIDSAFVPRVLVIQKGQQVRFPNSDDTRHHVYSFSKPKPFEIKLYKGSNIPPIEFEKPGLVILGCNIHDSMIGYIHVANNVYTVKTDKQGVVTIPAQKGDKITLWNERFIEGLHGMKTYQVTGDSVQTIKLNLLPPIQMESMDHSSHYHYDDE